MKSKNLNISIQGLNGSFHHQAAMHLFGDGIEIAECSTFDQVVDKVQSGEVDHGVMAIENSLAGSIIPNYKLLRHSALKISGEVGIKVHHNLLALPGTKLEDIHEIHSHPMALRQCNDFLKQHNHIKVVETFDTAGSAKGIKEKQEVHKAAIAGHLAAKTYKMEILADGIEDHNMNFTRFLGVSRPDSILVNKQANKVSVYFETAHEAGSLAKLLTVISDLKINLSKLQSYPIPSKNTLYGFYATFELQSATLSDLVNALKLSANHHQILGAYERGATHG